jgi:hypothetical protein
MKLRKQQIQLLKSLVRLHSEESLYWGYGKDPALLVYKAPDNTYLIFFVMMESENIIDSFRYLVEKTQEEYREIFSSELSNPENLDNQDVVILNCTKE